jgi:hypothetical protein
MAELAGDTKTAELAASIREDEEQMLGFLLEEIPTLTEAVFGADVDGNPSYDPTKTGAAEAVKGAADDARDAADSASRSAKAAAGGAKDTARRTAAGARAAASTTADGARTTAKDAADDAQAAAKTPPVDPDADKPWAGYDELSVEEVRAVLLTADAETTAQVDAYERANRARKGILGVTEPQVQSA